MDITPSIQDFFREQNVEIILFPTAETQSFSELEKFIQFIESEGAFWNDCSLGRLAEVRNNFYHIAGLLKNNDPFNDENRIKNNLLNAINIAERNDGSCVFSSTPEGKLLKDLYETSHIQANHAFDYMFRRTTVSSFSYDLITGIIYAYNCQNAGKFSQKNIKAEKEALSDLKVSYHNELNQLSTEFFSRADAIKKEFEVVKVELKEGQKDTESEARSFIDKSKKNIDDLENLYKKSIDDLKNLYEEKLRLEGPAKYWNEVHNNYNTKGETWRDWSIKASIGFIAFLSILLYNAPQSLFEQLNFNSVKATIIFALIASIGIYMIRFFVMLSTSAYHLSRDAYERYQLTHIYLSLWNAKAINESERNVVLQSLFSRADTGLLKGESSPSFPGGVLDQLLKNMSK